MSETPLANPSGHSIGYETVLRSTSPSPRPAPGTTDPSGVSEGRRGSSVTTTPGQRPTPTAPRRRCQKAWIVPSSGNDAHRPAPRPSCAPVAVRDPNNPRSGSSLRVVTSGLSWRPIARQTRPQHLYYPPG